MEYKRINLRIPSPVIFFAFISTHAITIIRYIGVDFQFGVLHCVRQYNEDFVTTGFVLLYRQKRRKDHSSLLMIKFERNYIRDSSGVFSISSLAKISMT